MLTEAPIALRLGSLFVDVITTLTGPGLGMIGVGDSRGAERGRQGAEMGPVGSLSLDFAPVSL